MRPITAPPPSSPLIEAHRLVIWRQALVESLWRPGRRNEPTIRTELRRIERALVDIYWPRWREAL